MPQPAAMGFNDQKHSMKVLKFLPRFRRAYRELEMLQEREGWPRWKIESFQLDRINLIWRHAITHVPYYQNLIFKLALPPSFSSLAEFTSSVPLLHRDTVKDQPLAFISEKATSGNWQRTGGSTGKPLDIYWGLDAHLEVLRTNYRFYNMWGIDIFDRMVFLWGHGASFSPGLAGFLARIKQPLEDRLRKRLRLSAYHLRREDLRVYLQRIAAFRPASLYGYSNAVYLLAEEAMALGFHCDSLNLMILTSEPICTKIIDRVERAFRVPAISEYGSIECGFIAGEHTDRTLRVREDIVFLETIGMAEGNYDIVLTVLTNPSFPLIRYSIGDVTSEPLKAPSAGFAILESVDGRENDLLMSRTGQILHPNIVTEIFEHTPGVRKYRVTQKADGSLAVMVELMDRQVTLDTVILSQKLSNLTEGYPVKAEVVGEIPTMASGKHRWIVSERTKRIIEKRSEPQKMDILTNPHARA